MTLDGNPKWKGVPLEYPTVGLCEEFHGDPSNNRLMPDGNLTLDANEWGDSWNLDPRYGLDGGEGEGYLWSMNHMVGTVWYW